MLGQCKHTPPRSVNYYPYAPQPARRPRPPARDEKQKARFSRAIKYASPPPPPPQLLLSFFLFNSLSFLVDLADSGGSGEASEQAGRKLLTSRSHGATFAPSNAHVFSHPTLSSAHPHAFLRSSNARWLGQQNRHEPTETAERKVSFRRPSLALDFLRSSDKF